MSTTALIKITQGANTAAAGQAVQGDLTSGAVTYSNGDDTGTISWFYELLETPPGSAIATTTQGPGATATFTHAQPDAVGSYRMRLTTRDSAGNISVDIRNLIVPTANAGFLLAPTEFNPPQLPHTGPVAKPDELNVGGQTRGWAGTLTQKMWHYLARTVDVIFSRQIDITQAPYYCVPNNPSKAAFNTAALEALIAAAPAGSVIHVPTAAGLFYVAKGSLGANPEGFTSAIRLTKALTIQGDGSGYSGFQYSAAGGAYDCLVDNDRGGQTGITIRGIGLLGNAGAKFGVKLNLAPYLLLDDVSASGCTAVSIAVDGSYKYELRNCNVAFSTQVGVSIGGYPGVNGAGGQEARITGLEANGCKIGLFISDATEVVISSCEISTCTWTGIFLHKVRGVTLNGTRFERNNETGGNGLVFTNLAGPTRCSVWLHRGTFNSTSVPTAWTFTMDPQSDGQLLDAAAYNNPGVTITGCVFSTNIAGESAIGGNAYEGISITGNVHESTGLTPIFGFIATNAIGQAMKFTANNNRGFVDPTCLSDATYFLWYLNTNTGFCETAIEGVTVENLIGQDTIAELSTRFLNDTNTGNGELLYHPTQTYEGRPVYKIVGGAYPPARAITIDVSAHPEYANRIVYIAARVYSPSAYAQGAAPTNTVQTNIFNSGGAHALTFGNDAWVLGWQLRSVMLKLPATGTVSLGFSKNGTADCLFADPVIAILGAPFSAVVAAGQTLRPTKTRTIADVMPYNANVTETYSSNGAGTICGVPMTVRNQANSSPTMAVTAAAGLVVRPTTGHNFISNEITAPAIDFSPTALFPQWAISKRIRARVVVGATTLVDANDKAFLGIYDGTVGNGVGSFQTSIHRGNNASTAGFTEYCYSGGSGIYSPSTNAATLTASNSCITADLPTPGANGPSFYVEAATSAGVNDPTTRACSGASPAAFMVGAYNFTTANCLVTTGGTHPTGAGANPSFTIARITIEVEL